MLSVLIPTYNNDITELVYHLHKQLKSTGICFEIIVIDDASNSILNIKNESINKKEFCSFFSLPKNIGRSAIRNLLVKKAKYKWLLFLDSDVLPTTMFFVKNYLNSITKTSELIIGGIAYSYNSKKLLRWKLGKKREEKCVQVRSFNSYKYLFTGNFLIKKKTAKKISFNEQLTQYGYEDLLFAKKIAKKRIAILHINNPVFHLGIDENKLFIIKTKKALQNLSFLLKTKQLSYSDTKITSVYKKLNKWNIVVILSWFTPVFEKISIIKSSLFFYDLFRLGYFSKQHKKGFK